jgi:hypothetical protein
MKTITIPHPRARSGECQPPRPWRRATVLLLAAPLALAGCVVGPGYAGPPAAYVAPPTVVVPGPFFFGWYDDGHHGWHHRTFQGGHAGRRG